MNTNAPLDYYLSRALLAIRLTRAIYTHLLRTKQNDRARTLCHTAVQHLTALRVCLNLQRYSHDGHGDPSTFLPAPLGPAFCRIPQPGFVLLLVSLLRRRLSSKHRHIYIPADPNRVTNAVDWARRNADNHARAAELAILDLYLDLSSSPTV